MANPAQAACQNCGAQLNPDTLFFRFEIGTCNSCGEAVCYLCGCTHSHPCLKPCVGAPLACSWYGPGVCSFCLFSWAADAYRRVCLGLELEPFPVAGLEGYQTTTAAYTLP